MERYNLVVIGAGSAGLVVAAGAAGLGARVALVERGAMGGDCLNFGCVPSKALLRCARAAAEPRRGRFGVAPAAPAAPWPAVAGRVQSVIDAIAPHDSVERFTELGVEVVQGTARLVSPHAVEVALNGGGTRTLRGRALVLATGGGPLVPPIPGLAEAGYLTNETVFTHPELPARLCVLGGGPIGVELGQAFARLGARVTIVEMLPRVLPREDADAAEVVAQALAADGVELRTSTRAVRVERVQGGGGGKRVICRPAGAGAAAGAAAEAGADEQVLEVDEVLVAVGRRAATADMGLEALGVALEHGRIRVDTRMRTSVRSIYACGDVVGPYPFTHMADAQARVVVQNALLPLKARMNYRVVPWCTFTDPELARVGLNEDEARAEGTPYRALVVPFSGVDRAICDGETAGFLKVLTPPGRDDILGATLVGEHAGELLHEIVLAMQARLRLRDLAATVHIYPTLAQIFRRAGDEARKAGFTPRLQRWMRAYLRWQRR